MARYVPTILTIPLLATCAVSAVAVRVTATSTVSPVQKVIGLLGDMSAKVAEEQKDGEKVFQEFAAACDKDATDKEYAISDSKEVIETESANIQAAEATISELEAKIQDVTGQIRSAEEELGGNTHTREKEHVEFVAKEKELLDTVEALNKAHKALEGKGSFVQMSKQTQTKVREALQSLGLIVESAKVLNAPKASLETLLQEREDDEDSLDLSQDPEGPPVSGGGILETVAGLLEKAEGGLSEARKGEMEAAHAFEMLKMNSETEIKTLNEELSAATQQRSEVLEDLAACQDSLAMEKEALQATEKGLRSLKQGCQARAGEFEEETKDSSEELKVLAKAKEILTKKFALDQEQPSFLQVGARTALRARQRLRSRARARTVMLYGREMEESKAVALESIQHLGQRLKSPALVSLAFRAAADPFAKVRGMVEEMLAKLLQEAADDASQHAFCEKEIGESQASQDSKGEKLDKVETRLAKVESAQAQVAAEVSALMKEIADIDTAMQSATAVRNAEKAAFMAAAKDFSESQEACAAAIEVLQGYYAGTSLLQLSSRSGVEAGGTAGSDAQGSEGIIGLLEVSESDFAKMLSEAKAGESGGEDEYKKMMAENKALKAMKTMEMKSKESQMKSLKTSLDEFSSDKEGLDSELAAVDEYLSKLKPQCETKVPSYEETKARRDQEIEGLKDALDTLDAQA